MPYTPKIEVEFTEDVWTDITPYYLAEQGSITVQRGRSDESSEVQEGTLGLTLNNSDGRFTPSRAASPYYPNVIDGKHIRVSVVFTPKNWVTNPSFETNLNGWIAGGSVLPILSQSATHVHNGSQAMLITWGTGGTFPQAQTIVTGLIAGRQYTISAWVWIPSGSPAVALGIAGIGSGSASTTFNAFQQISYTFIATAETHTLQVLAATSPTSGNQAWVDEVQLELGGSATTFSSVGAVTFVRAENHSNGWPTSWEVTGGTPFMPQPITATDHFKHFGSIGELRSVLEEEVLYDTNNPNQLSIVQHSLEDGTTTGWIAGSNTTIANAFLTKSLRGARALQMTKMTSIGTLFAQTPSGTGGTFIPANSAVKVFSGFKAGSQARSCRIRVAFHDLSGSYLGAGSDLTGSLVIDGPDDWVRANVSGASPNQPTFAAVELQVLNGAVSEVHYADDIQLIVTSPAFGTAYFPLSEPEGSTTFSSITKHQQGAGTVQSFGSGLGAGSEDPIQFGAGTGPGTDELSAVMLNPASSTDGGYLEVDLTTPVGGVSVTFEAWFRIDSGLTSRTIASLRSSSGAELRLWINASGKAEVFNFTPSLGGFVYNAATTNNYNDGQTHHLAVVELQTGTTTITYRTYIDGVAYFDTTYTGFAPSLYSKLTVGSDALSGQLFKGTISHVAAHSAPLHGARLATRVAAGKTGIAGETTGQRIARIADWIGQYYFLSYDNGVSTVGWQGTSGQTPLEAFRAVEATEQGVLFGTRDHRVEFHDRHRRQLATTGPPDLILDAQQADQIGTDIVFPGDDFGRVNDATVDRERASSQRAVNEASIEKYEYYRKSFSTIHELDNDAMNLARWTVNVYGEPLVRLPTVTCDLRTLAERNPTLVPAILNTDISTLMRLTNLPSQAPVTTIDLFAEGYQETLGFDEWKITFNCSPANIYDAWLLGVSGSSELGVTTRLGY